MQAYLQEYWSSAQLGNGKFGGLTMPREATHASYLGMIGELPDQDMPSLFGLPDNIERSVQRANSAGVLRALQQVRRLGELAGAARMSHASERAIGGAAAAAAAATATATTTFAAAAAAAAAIPVAAVQHFRCGRCHVSPLLLRALIQWTSPLRAL